MTVQLYLFSFVYHVLQLFSSYTDQRFFHPVFVTVAVKLCGDGLIDLNIKAFQQCLQQRFGCMAFLQHCGDRSDIFQIFFQLTDHLFFRKRHELDDKTACLFHRIIFFHQNTKADRGGNLFTGGKIIGQILGNFTGLQHRLSHILLFQPHIFDLSLIHI